MGVARAQPCLGGEHDGGAVRVAYKVAVEQVLEVTLTALYMLLDRGKRRREGQRHEGIAIIEPGGERTQHQGEAAREGPSILLAQAELRSVERRLDGLASDAFGGQPLHRLQDQRLDLVAIHGGDTLQAGREERWVGLHL